MRTIAVTGSIGMGKSTVARMFANAGLPLFDADAEVRAMQGPGGALVEAIGRQFPGTVSGGLLDRDRLAKQVLEDPAELQRLEAIVHPAVQAARERFIASHAGAAALVFEIPLLLETGGADEFDTVVVVSAPADVQRARVLARPGMTLAKLDSILDRQMPDGEKRTRADFVVDTGGDFDATRRQVSQILACLGLGSGA